MTSMTSKVKIGDTIKGQISPGMVIKGHFIPDLKMSKSFGQKLSITVPPPPTIQH